MNHKITLTIFVGLSIIGLGFLSRFKKSIESKELLQIDQRDEDEDVYMIGII